MPKLESLDPINASNSFLDLPVLEHEIFARLPYDSQFSFFQVCKKTSLLQTSAHAAKLICAEVGLTYKYCKQYDKTTLLFLAVDKNLEAKIVLYDLIKKNRQVYALNNSFPLTPHDISPIHCHNGRILIYDMFFHTLLEVSISKNICSVDKLILSKHHAQIIGFINQDKNIYGVFCRTSMSNLTATTLLENLITETKINFEYDTAPYHIRITNDNEVINENDIVSTDPTQSENGEVIELLKNVLNLKVTPSFERVIGHYPGYDIECYSINNLTKIYAVLEYSKIKDKITVSYDFFPTEFSRICKFLRLDENHCLYLTEDQKLYMTRFQGREYCLINQNINDLMLFNDQLLILKSDKALIVDVKNFIAKQELDLDNKNSRSFPFPINP